MKVTIKLDTMNGSTDVTRELDESVTFLGEYVQGGPDKWRREIILAANQLLAANGLDPIEGEAA